MSAEARSIPIKASFTRAGGSCKHLSSMNNELQLSKRLFEGNTLTGGLYIAHYSQVGTYLIGNEMLMSNTPNARPIVVSYVSSGITYHRTDPQGFIDFSNNFDVTDHGK